ncbi:hypothetical protein QYE76_041785 [Lolium multiflorum]|uniref:CCHC-type domain-containing protein n=1 Tax=Lolium multiflorum TaxID=4521 RepID=A0AAD8TFI9_LOLMU|nr:hypothetical protein QYE76_041785 [Lolium multiflorum]
MSHHIINFLAQGSGAFLRRERQIYSIERAFGCESFEPNAMCTGPFERADEIGFEESLKLIILLLVIFRQIFVLDWFIRHLSCRSNLKLPFVIPPPVVDYQPYEWFLARSADGKRLMIILTVNHIVIAHGDLVSKQLNSLGDHSLFLGLNYPIRDNLKKREANAPDGTLVPFMRKNCASTAYMRYEEGASIARGGEEQLDMKMDVKLDKELDMKIFHGRAREEREACARGRRSPGRPGPVGPAATPARPVTGPVQPNDTPDSTRRQPDDTLMATGWGTAEHFPRPVSTRRRPGLNRRPGHPASTREYQKMRLIFLIIPNQGIDLGLPKSPANSPIPCSGDHLLAMIPAALRLLRPRGPFHQLQGDILFLLDLPLFSLLLLGAPPMVTAASPCRSSSPAPLRSFPSQGADTRRFSAPSRTPDSILLVPVRPVPRDSSSPDPVCHGHPASTREYQKMRLIFLIIPNQGIDLGLPKSPANSPIPCSGDHLLAMIPAALRLLRPRGPFHQLQGDILFLLDLPLFSLLLLGAPPMVTAASPCRSSSPAPLRSFPSQGADTRRFSAPSRTPDSILLVPVRPVPRDSSSPDPVCHGWFFPEGTGSGASHMSASDEKIVNQENKNSADLMTWREYEALRNEMRREFRTQDDELRGTVQGISQKLDATNETVTTMTDQMTDIQRTLQALQMSVENLTNQQQQEDEDLDLEDEAPGVGRGAGRGNRGRGFAELGRRGRGLDEEDGLGKPKFSIPKFEGGADVEEYLSWELKIEKLWRLHNYTEDRKIKLASSEFDGYALRWWDALVRNRQEDGEPPIITWRAMKKAMNSRFVPTNYLRTINDKLTLLRQGVKTIDEYYMEMEMLMQRGRVPESLEMTMQRFLNGLKYDIKGIVRHYSYTNMNQLLHHAREAESQMADEAKVKGRATGAGCFTPRALPPTVLAPSTRSAPYSTPPRKPVSNVSNAKKSESAASTSDSSMSTARNRDMACHTCGGKGHFKRDCPNRKVMIINEDNEYETGDDVDPYALDDDDYDTDGEDAYPSDARTIVVSQRALNVLPSASTQRCNLFQTKALVGPDKPCKSQYGGIQEADFVRKIHLKTKELIEKKGKSNAARMNKKRKEILFKPGDMVWVHFRKDRFPKLRKSKLLPRGAGPYKLLAKINDNAYSIDLPLDEFGVSNSFNVADLTPYDGEDLGASRSTPFEGGGGDDEDIPTSLLPPSLPFEDDPGVKLKSNEVRIGPITRARMKRSKHRTRRRGAAGHEDGREAGQGAGHEDIPWTREGGAGGMRERGRRSPGRPSIRSDRPPHRRARSLARSNRTTRRIPPSANRTTR